MSFTPNDGTSTSVSRMEECIKEIESWMLINRLKLYGDKTELLVIGTQQKCKKITDISLNVGGSVIKANEKARNLGVVFDKNLTLKVHVNELCKSARYHLHNISLARRYLGIEYKILMLIFKCVKDLAPNYLKELLKLRKAY